MRTSFHHNQDGYVFPYNVGEHFRTGRFTSVPTLFGYNHDEASLFYSTDPQPSIWIKSLARTGRQRQFEHLALHYGDQAAETLINSYGLDQPGNFDMGGSAMQGDEIFGMNVRYVTARNEVKGTQLIYIALGGYPRASGRALECFMALRLVLFLGLWKKSLDIVEKMPILRYLCRAIGRILPGWVILMARI